MNLTKRLLSHQLRDVVSTEKIITLSERRIMSANKGYVELSDCMIISDLLYFISNKIKTTPIKNVVSICHTFYADHDFVFNEKKKLCDVTGDNLVNRRGDDRRLKNLEDICNIFIQRDASGDFIPKFASLDLNNIPLNDEGEPSLGQLLSTINNLKRNIVTNEQLSQSMKILREELAPSSAAPPPPVSPSLPFAPPWAALSSEITPSAPNIVVNPESAAALAPSNILNRRPSTNGTTNKTPTTESTLPTQSSTLPTPPSTQPTPPFSQPTPSSTPPIFSSGEGSRIPGGGGGRGRGQSVRGGGGGGSGGGGGGGQQRRIVNLNRESRGSSKPRTIIGKSVNNGLVSFKGADLTVNKYVGRVHNDVTADELRQYICNTGVTVVELETLETKHQRFQSFRLCVKRADLDRIEKAEFWPEGVIFSPFFRPRTKLEGENNNGDSAASPAVR